MKKYRHKTTFSSFLSAYRGIRLAAKSQKNLRTGLLIAGFVLTSGILLKFTVVEMALITLSIGFVLFAELTNTVTEFVVDTYFRTKYSEIAKMSKDVAAGSVLLAIFISGIIGAILFLPKIIALIM
ncbi:MAG: hypothetical protein A2Y25_08220 [Candidatus Melainabacteria bacterium GWF2_37_15]|nr:MAG: hypothetical protein A2Y25_08220 [Candidatus Melainabacteria bacterium GWF2_37_15]